MRTFKKKAAFAAVGNFSTTAALAVIMVLIAKVETSVETTEMVGRFSYAFTICSPLFLLASLRLRDVSATESPESYSTQLFFNITLVTNGIALASVLPVCWLLRLESETILLAVSIGLWKVVNALRDIVLGFHQRTANMQIVATLQVARSLATIAAFAVTFLLSGNLVLSIFTVFIVNLLLFLLQDLRTLPSTSWGFSTGEGTQFQAGIKMALIVLPLGLGGAIFALNMVIPRVLLEKYFSYEQVGIFAVAALFARLGTPIMQALGQTASARLAESFRNRDASGFMAMMRKAVVLPVCFGVTSVLAAWFAGPGLLKLVFSPAFEIDSASAALIMVYSAMIYTATFLTYGMIAARRMMSQLVILLLTVCTIAVVGLILIPNFGVLGACISLVASAAVRIVGTYFVIGTIIRSMKSERPQLPASQGVI